MKKPACEKLGQIKRFFDSYKALVTIALVFLSSVLYGQDSTTKRQQLNTPLGYGQINVRNLFLPPTDTSFKPSIKDTNALVIVDRTAFVWSKQSGVLRWDTLKAQKSGSGAGNTNSNVGSAFRLAIPSTNNLKTLLPTQGIVGDSSTSNQIAVKLDTAWLSANYAVGYDPTYFNVTSNILGLNVGALPSGSGPIVWVANYDSVKAQRPGNGTIYYTADRRASYQFVSASTATADDRSILMPTVGSGAGRWVILPQDGIVKTSQLNILPGATDWTSVLYTATKNVAAYGGTVFFDLAGTYYITPAVTGGLQADFANFKLDGIGAQYVRLLATTYTGMNRTMIGATNATPKKGFSVKNITVDLGETYANHTFAGSSRNNDTTSRAFYLDGFDSAYIGNVVIRGGTAAGIDMRKTTNSLFDRIYGDSIGGNFFTNQYDTACHHITISHSRSDIYGARWPWDAGAGKRRNGADFWQGHSGTRGYIKLLYDTAVNGTLNAWEFEEGLGAGYGNEIAYCYLDGRGRNCMGMSPGGDGYDNITGGGVMQFNADIHHNKQVNIGPVVFSAADSATHFSPNLIEASVMNGTQFHDNIWMNNHIISGNTTKNVRFTNDIFLNDSGPRGLQGESIILEVGTSNLGTTDSSDIALDKCVIQARGGELVRTDGNTVVKFAGLINCKIGWSGDMIGTEANLGFGSARPFISFKGSTFNGKSAGTWIYTNNTGAAININADSTDLRLSDVDFSNINNSGHTSPVISTTGSLANLLAVSGSTLQQVIGPPGAPSFKNLLTLPSGGGSTNLSTSRTDQQVTIVNSTGTNSIVDSAKANTVGATGLAGTFTGYNAQVLAGKPKVFNVKTDFGAKGDSTSDDSGPIQAAINAARAAGGGEVFLPNGYYSAKNAILPTVGGNPCNCQLYIPYSPADTAMVITLRGETPGDFEFQGVAGFPAPKKGVIIESSLTTATAGDALMAEVKGPGSGTFTKTNQTDPAIYNITFRTKTTSGTNPLTALNLRYASKVKLDFVKADINQSLADSPDPSGIGSYGIILPEKSNHASVDIGTIRVGGFDIGMQIGEHAVIKDFQNACNNVGLVTINSDHSSSIQTFEGELNKTNIRYDGDLNLVILNYNTEQYDGSLGSKWYNFIEDVHFSSYSAYAAKPTTLTIGSSSVGVSGTAGEYIKFATNDSSRVNMLSRNHMMVKTGVFNRGDVDFRNYTGTFAGDGTTPIRIMNNISAPSGKRKWLEYADGLGNHYFSRLADNGLTAVNHLTFTSDVNATLSDTLIAEKGIHGAGGELAILDLANIHAGVSLSGVPTSTNDINVIKGTSNSTTLGLIASSSSAFNTVNGPFMAFRGNSYSAAATQRGNVYLYAGSPSTPLTGEGIIDIGTAAGSAITVTGSNVIKFKTNTPTVGDAWIATNTDGSGHWASLSSSGTPAGSNTQIQFNNSGAFGGLSGVTTPDGTNTLSINTLQLPGSGSGIGTKIYNNVSNPTAALTNLYPASGTNINTSLYLIPKGTGASGDKSDLILFGTDFVADASNFDYSNWRATGTSFDFYSGAVGTGTVRPINIFTGSNTNQIQLKTDGGLKFGAYGSGTNTGTPAYYLAVDASHNIIETTGGSGATTVGSPNSTSTANGGDISSGTLTLHYADGTNPGLLSATTQNIAGVKTFTGKVVLKGNNANPVATNSTGAGTGGANSTTGTDQGFTLQIDVGTSPAGSNATIATVALQSAFPSGFGTSVVFSPANAAAAALSGATGVYMTSNGTTITVKSGTSALTASTTYIWNVHVF